MADPVIEFQPSKYFARQGSVRVVGVTQDYTLHYGDGHSRNGRPNQAYQYTWPTSGPYTIALVLDGEQTPTLTKPVRILEDTKLSVTVAQASDADYTVQVTFDDPMETYAFGRYQVVWEDGGEAQTITAQPERSIQHYYGAAGTHHFSILDLWSGVQQVYAIDLTGHAQDPQLTLSEDTTDTTRKTATLTVDTATGTDRKLSVSWGDGAFTEIDATPGATASYQYPMSGTWYVYAVYTDDNDAWWADYVTVPFTDGA